MANSEEAIYRKSEVTIHYSGDAEDNAEWNFKHTVKDLVTLEDIKGVVHNHTTYSDGVDKLEDFVKACIKQGFEYAVISDHSKNAHYAGGLKKTKF
jgi:DNA polymerase (family 10)